AYGTANGGGHVLLSSSSSILTGGTGSGTNGNVLVIAGAMIDSPALQMGTINTAGGTGGGGAITIAAAPPTFTANTSSMTFGTNGAISSGNDFQSGTNTTDDLA